MEILFSWDVRHREKRKAKRRLIVIGGLFLLLFLFAAAYLWIYDGSKPTEFEPSLNETRIRAELDRLAETEQHLETQTAFRQGSLKAWLVFSGGKTQAASLYEQNKGAIDNAETAYRRQKEEKSQPAEIMVSNWTYLPLWKSIGGGLYASCYGSEAAKGKPNYRYMIEITVQKGAGQYTMRAFCNRPNDLDELITALVDEVNALAG